LHTNARKYEESLAEKKSRAGRLQGAEKTGIVERRKSKQQILFFI